MYKVKEIFRSIQGEGFNTGRESVFVRFTGCNLWNGIKYKREKAICNFCDTDFLGTNGKNGGTYNAEQLVNEIERVWKLSFSLKQKNVILTGGEPLLQVDKKLVAILKEKKFHISVETNGTIKSHLNFDWVCVSPKDPKNWALKNGDELKIIYPQNKFILKDLLTLNFRYFFLQPKEDKFVKVNLNKTLQYCALNKNWSLSLQLHKIIGVQ